MEPVGTGQKRKRVTRQTTNEDRKRKETAQRWEIAKDNDGYAVYAPPSKPIKKSNEVYVQLVKDVSGQSYNREDGC